MANEDLKMEAERALGSVKDAGRETAEARKADVASFLSDVSSAIHTGADDLRSRQHPLSADYADLAAKGLASMGTDLGKRDVVELTGMIDDMARRQPVLTAALGFAAGFALVRLARSGREPARQIGSHPDTRSEDE